jgi:hypothetical protein
VIYSCCNKLRLNAIARATVEPGLSLNGIDYLEVVDGDLQSTDPLRQRTLLVHCLKPVPSSFTRDNLQLKGGESIKNIKIEWATPATVWLAEPPDTKDGQTIQIVQAETDQANLLVVRTSEPGDFSTYTLRLIPIDPDDPNWKFDPQLDSIDFCFKVDCPSDFDCKPDCFCPPEPIVQPDIDYLARDYSTFRRLLLDRMSVLAPQWRQSSVADYGIAIPELLAYFGDHFTYRQDAVATEAYLGTARRRVSLRRHALMVDYPMHDGCNARAWIHIEVEIGADFTLPQSGIQFLTLCPGFPVKIESGSKQMRDAMMLSPLVFEPLHAQALFSAHNQISFHTWGDTSCCLPRGAIKATLKGTFPDLKNQLLLFEEILGPHTGVAGDADKNHRHVVRLTKVTPGTDPLTTDPITDIEWGAEDALPFPLCISSVTDEEHGSQYQKDVSVARGNIVLVDHGRTIDKEPLDAVPAPTLFTVPDGDCDPCTPVEPAAVPVRYRPRLQQVPLTQAATVPSSSPPAGVDEEKPPAFDPKASAAAALSWSMGDVLPAISLFEMSVSPAKTWLPHRTLLNSDALATNFVVEVEDDGGARLRFGGNGHGLGPEITNVFKATYRIGNGISGNVGAESIFHVVGVQSDIDGIKSLRNPLAAIGGVDPESADSVRRNAPEAFRTQERAVTPEDYAAVTERHPDIQRAAATLRWTGSWYTVFITLDPDAGVDPGPLKKGLEPFVDRYRMAGYDLEFNDPIYVPLEIGLHVCVKPDYFRSDVKAGLLELFSDRVLPDGRRALFHPDNFTFGQTVYLSPLYAAAHAVPGVAAVEIKIFQRQGTDDSSYLANGEMPLNRLEIACLDNNPNFPDQGVLDLEIHGGK